VVDEGLIAEAGRRLSRAAGESAQVILFGSHARGDARTDSDLDFLVIEPEVEDRVRSRSGSVASCAVWVSPPT
jgi:uncharacterized protein